MTSPGRFGGLFLYALGGIAVFGALTLALSATGLVSGDLASAVSCTLLVVGGFAGLVAWAKLARSAFGEAHLEVLAPVHEGGSIELMLVLEPKRPLEVDPGECSFLLTAVNTGGESALSILSERQPLALPPSLAQRLEHRVTLAVPPKLPVTTHDVTSTVTATIGVRGWPDLVLVRKLEVLPKKS